MSLLKQNNFSWGPYPSNSINQSPSHLAYEYNTGPGLILTLIITGGTITLASSDPFAHPIIDVNMLSEPVDLAIMREALRSARKLLSAPVFEGSVSGSLSPPSNLTTNEELNSFIHSTVVPYLHSVGSAGMSPRGANWGVVDPDHRVKGTNGRLRIIDLSVLVSTFVYGYSIGSIYVAQAEYSKWTCPSARLCPCGAGECNNQKSMEVSLLGPVTGVG